MKREILSWIAVLSMVFLTLLSLAAPPNVHSKTQNELQDIWQPATYRGLTIGKSTRKDMLRIFGKPNNFSEYKRIEKNRKPNSEVQYYYDNRGELPGGLIVGINNKTKKIVWIRLRPDKLSKEDAIRHFGPDYVVKRYGFDDCIDGTEAVPIFESPDGSWVLIEYRERGITVHANDDGRVDEISYG